MGRGRTIALLYSAGVSTPAMNSDPTLSIGGASPPETSPAHGIGTVGTDPARCHGRTGWSGTMPDPTHGTIFAGFGDTLIFAEAGDWLFCVDQNYTTPGAFDPANDVRGSFARLLSVEGSMGETSNDGVPVDVVLDRPLPGVPENGDRVWVCKEGNVFASVTGVQAVSGRTDHRMLYLWKRDAGATNDNDDLMVWIEPIVSHGVKLEIQRPGDLNNADETMDNVLSDETESPFNKFGKVIEERALMGPVSKPLQVISREQARNNGRLFVLGSNDAFKIAPFWIRRTVPPGTPPGLCVFALRVASETAEGGTVQLDPYFQINAGTLILFEVHPPDARVIDLAIDRRLHASGEARVTAVLADGLGNRLANRWVTLSTDVGGITQAFDALTDDRGRTRGILTLPAGVGGADVTLSASLISGS